MRIKTKALSAFRCVPGSDEHSSQLLKPRRLVYRIGVRVGYRRPRFPHGIDAGGDQEKEEHAAGVGYDVIPFEPVSEYPGLQGLERATKSDYRCTADEPL